MPEEAVDERAAHAPRAFWSGTLTFGLVSIPVDLFAAQRTVRPRLRMLDEGGTPLSRVYVSPKSGAELGPDEVVRGFEIDAGRFVEIGDEELESLAPEMSRDIHLRRFVPREALPPSHFRRAYYLAPAGQSTRAYAVLAQTMERTDRVGIATFVMRGKQQLVAIFARDGVLQAETLRFADEVRTPEDVGLTSPQRPSTATVRRMKQAIAALESDAIPLEPFRDLRTESIEALARRKLERGEGVVRAPLAEPDEEESWEPPDLVAVLKKRLAEEQAPRAAAPTADALDALPRSELYERAKALGIEGRSKMSKGELVRAIRARG